MRDLIRMVVVLTAICGTSGLVLSYVNEATREPREYQLLKYVKGPSLNAVLPEGYENDPITDKIVVAVGTDDKGKPVEKTVFPAKKGDEIIALAYDAEATGYHGTVSVMVGFAPDGRITGMSVMTHTETPGLGARITESAFTDQFKGLEGPDQLKLSSEGGAIDGISGATISSAAALTAVKQAVELFPKVKKEVL